MDGTLQIIEREYSDDELSQLSDAYQSLVREHKICGGRGLRPEGDELIDCECRVVYEYVRELIFARIPRIHWSVSIADANKSLHLPDASGCVWGGPLSGKTKFLAFIGKLAIAQGKKIVYLDVNELVAWGKDSENVFRNRLDGAHLILIDDLDRLVSTSMTAVSIVESTIRRLYDHGANVFVGCCDPDRIKPERLCALVGSFDHIMEANATGKLKRMSPADFLKPPFLLEAQAIYVK